MQRRVNHQLLFSCTKAQFRLTTTRMILWARKRGSQVLHAHVVPRGFFSEGQLLVISILQIA